MQRLFALSLSFSFVAVGACNCDNDLYAFPGRLNGLVCGTDDGQLLAGVKVSVVDSNGKSTEATTDANGDFKADKLSTGAATITVHEAAGDRAATVIIDAGKEASFRDSTCHAAIIPVGEIDGCICNTSAGSWVAAANVYVITDAGAVFSTGTDPVGCFALTGVPTGAQVLKVQKGAFYVEHAVTVVADQTVSIQSPASCDPPPPPADSGTVAGRVCAPDGTTWLSDATVSVTRADGSVATTTTDGDGRYTLTGVPTGDQNLNVTKGSFTSTVAVTVTANQTTTVPDGQCAIALPGVKIAVVTGDYDHVETVLSQLGVDPANVDTYEGANFSSAWVTGLLDDFTVLSQYDIVFLNCGLHDTRIVSFPDQTAISNLKQFVQNGGSVYASDWAYTVVETAWPDEIDFARTDTDFSPLAANSPKFGIATTGLAGTIVDAGLAAGMGSSSIALDYQLNEWVAMQAVAAGVTVYITGDAPLEDGTSLTNVPHTVGFNVGAGRVLYTSFHQEPGVNQQQERVLQLLMFEL